LSFRRGWKATRRWFQWLLARTLVATLPRIPYPLVRLFCRCTVAPIARLLHGKKADANLRLAFGPALGDERRRQIVRGVFVHLAEQAAELIAYLRLGERLFEGRLDDADGRRLLADFQAGWQGGWIALTGHVGNWELLGSWFARHARGGACVAIAKRMPNARLNELVERLRRRLGIETVYRDDEASRPINVLKSGRALAMVPDQDIKSMTGMFVDWFGRPAWTPIGPARLAYAANVPIWGAFLLRDGGRMKLRGFDPIWPDPTRDKEAEVARMTREWMAQFEAVVRDHPEQWPWYHARWKTQPT
jgi:KDO2-lipid IV(A) lauroyltransferase